MELPFLDLTAPGFATVSDDVRRARAKHWCARTPFGIAVLRHRQAGMILRDRRFRQGSHGWPDMIGLEGAFADFWKRSIISREGEGHKALRRIAQVALAEDHIRALIPGYEASAARLCEALNPNGFDMIDAITEPFAGEAIALLLGLPMQQAPALAHDASRLGLAMGPDAKQYEATSNAACRRLTALAGNLLDDPPPNSFVARMKAAAGDVARQDVIDLIVISIFGGVDTTRAQLAFAVWAFARHPDQWTWLRTNPNAIPQAIDEVIRMRPTTTWASREALGDMEFEGVPLRAGDTVHVLVHATGTDPATGHDSHFDIRRTTKGHFGFGGGAHHCLGHFVARTDMTAALRVMLDRWQAIYLAGEPVFLPDSGNTSPLSLFLRVEEANS